MNLEDMKKEYENMRRGRIHSSTMVLMHSLGCINRYGAMKKLEEIFAEEESAKI